MNEEDSKNSTNFKNTIQKYIAGCFVYYRQLMVVSGALQNQNGAYCRVVEVVHTHILILAFLWTLARGQSRE